MIIYFAIPFIMILLYLFVYKTNILNKQNKDKAFLIFTGCFLAILMGLKNYYVGTDTINYYNSFYYINELKYIPSNLEWGYVLLNKFVYLFSDQFWVMNFVSSVIVIGGIFYYIYKNSCNIFYSVLLFVLTFDYLAYYNIIRQGIAAAIMINAYTSVKQDKYLKASILTLIASLFHATALIFFVFIIICVLQKKRNIFIYYILSSFFGLMLVLGFGVITKLFPKYSLYLNADKIDLNVLYILIWVFILLFPMFINKKEFTESTDKDYIYAGSILVLCYVTISLSIVFSVSILVRIEYMLNIVGVVFVPQVNKMIKNNNNRLFYNGVIICGLLIYYVYRILGNVGGIVPYEMYW